MADHGKHKSKRKKNRNVKAEEFIKNRKARREKKKPAY